MALIHYDFIRQKAVLKYCVFNGVRFIGVRGKLAAIL